MRLEELVEQVLRFDEAAPKEQIKVLAWWLHTHEGKELFGPGDVRVCYDRLHINEPPALATYLTRMSDAKDLLKERGLYKLSRSVRADLDKKYRVHHSVAQVSKLLADLPGKVPDIAEKNFLVEAIRCYHVEAYRACIVMTWNLAYSHLLCWILANAQRLEDFNVAIPRRYPKKSPLTIAKYDGFEELKESEVIEVCNTADLLNGNMVRILKEKLGKRNTAAHPASVIIVQSQADDVVTDLVNNIVLALT
jgi:hypothetical protein